LVSRCSPTSSPRTNRRSPNQPLHWEADVDRPAVDAVAISTPDPRRRRTKLPRTLPGRRRLQPYSRADAPFFRSPGFFLRVGGLAALVGVGICMLALRAWSIQILHGRAYTAVATGQAYRTVDLVGPRGAIVDARGRLLAGMTGSYQIAADVAALGTIDRTGWHASPTGLRSLERLSKLVHKPAWTFIARIKRSVVRSPFAPAVVLPGVSLPLESYVAEHAQAFPGLKASWVPSRSYPQGASGGAYLGLLGEISPQMLGTKRYSKAKKGEIVGTSGVEAVYDNLLNGGFTRAHLRVDSMGRVVGPLQRNANGPAPPTLQLTIDERLQRATERALKDGMNDARLAGNHPTGGSAVVIDPRTGGIYAIASTPTFNQVEAAKDPNYIPNLYKDPATPTLNRAIAGVYPTGSTFKPIVAEAAMSAGIISPSTSLLCSGSFDLGGTVFHNVESGIFESMSLPTALSQSCDTWFYRLGDLIWSHDPSAQGTLIQQWARRFGLGASTGIDLTGDNPGVVPSPKWFQHYEGFPWTEGQTINLSIGQGTLQVSPLQLAVAYSTLANGGTVVRPHVADAVIRGASVRRLHFKPIRKLKLVNLWAIRQGLYDAAHVGTSAAIFGNFSIPVAGKTGTAESGPGRDDHSWYASWAPAGNPEVVVVVMIEHGGFGAEAAAPAAKEIYEAFFHVKK
jgi:penicillin-binding protein 2